MMIEQMIFILLIAFALFIVVERNLKRVVIAMGVFSLIASFCYLLFHAPDVALAEAIIGCALSTILYIVALKKYHTIYIFITTTSKTEKNDMQIGFKLKSVLPKIKYYCIANDLQAQYIYTWDTPKEIMNEHVCDLILVTDDDKVTIYGTEDEIHVKSIIYLLEGTVQKDNITFVSMKSEGINEII